MNQTDQRSGKRSVIPILLHDDPLVFIFSLALLVAMGAATVYHFTYAIVDETVMPGNMEMRKNDDVLLKLDVADKNLEVQVTYRGIEMKGRLQLAGAERDTVLYQLRDVELLDGSDEEGLVLFVRVPRSGLQGNLLGPWMAYFSFPARNLMYSDWVFVQTDGIARVGSADGFNAMLAQRRELEERTNLWSWMLANDHEIVLSAT